MTRTPKDEFLDRHVEAWKARTPSPPEGLEQRIVLAVRAEHEATARSGQTVEAARGSSTPGEHRTATARWRRPRAWPRPVWAAAGAIAALLLVAAGLSLRAATFRSAPMQADRLLVADALRDAEAAEREHARAIARLQQAAQPVLARATDPEIPAQQAARLMMLGNRLRFLDQTIAEIRGYLRDNPGHPGARSTLLAAYSEKTTVLRDVVALDEEISS